MLACDGVSVPGIVYVAMEGGNEAEMGDVSMRSPKRIMNASRPNTRSASSGHILKAVGTRDAGLMPGFDFGGYLSSLFICISQSNADLYEVSGTS